MTQPSRIEDSGEADGQVRNGTEGKRGIGLGLQLCRTYLDVMNAGLLIESEPGQGACFEIHFPTPAAVASASGSMDRLVAAEPE